MVDLNELLGDDWEDEAEEGETIDENDPLASLEDDDEDEAPLPAKKKKTSKKKASKKKAAKKKATSKPTKSEDDLFADEDGDDEASEPESKPESKPEPPKKKRGPKPGSKRKPRAPKVGSDPLGTLRDELTSIAEESGEKERLAQLKAEIRTAKQLSTKLSRFADKATAAAEAQHGHVAKLEAELEKLTE